jgi:hypothetical protein
MNSKLLFAGLTATLLLGASVSAMAADAPKPPKITAAVAKQLQAAQTAGNKKDFPTALAAVDEAKKVSGRTPYDDLMIARIATSIHAGMQDMASAEVDADAAADIDPTAIPDADRGTVYRTAMLLGLQQKHYDHAAKYAKLYAGTNPTADHAEIGEALLYGNDAAGALAFAQKDIDASTAAGQKPSATSLRIVMNSQVKLKDEAAAEKTLEALVANYGDPDDWKQLLGVSLTTRGMQDLDYIYVGRLEVLRGDQISSADASLVGSAANSNRLGLYGDAETMQKFGGPAPDPRAAADRKSMPQQIAAGAKNDGEYNVKTAEAAYGYGMYADAENLARAAKSKSGVKNPSEPDMVLAMALTAQGKYAEAAPIFDGIKPTNAASARVVRLWSYFAKAKANPGAATAAK